MKNSLCVGLVLLGVSLAASVTAQNQASLWNGVFSDQQAERGAEKYGARCASCHSVDLRGNSNSPSLLGMSFMFLWEGRSVGELYSKIRTEMPSDQPGSMPMQDYLDIVTFILRENQFPVGSTELTLDQSLLDGILIVPKGG